MADSSSTFLITRLLGITSSGFLSGFAFSASYYGLPAVALAPVPLRLKQWQVIYDLGKLVAPPLGAASAVSWGVAAWTSYAQRSDDWKSYAAAGLLTFAILPWTIVAMMPTNNDLMRRAKAGEELEGESESFKTSSEQVLATWKKLNWVRAVLPLVGAWVGLYPILK